MGSGRTFNNKYFFNQYPMYVFNVWRVNCVLGTQGAAATMMEYRHSSSVSSLFSLAKQLVSSNYEYAPVMLSRSISRGNAIFLSLAHDIGLNPSVR